MVSLCLLEVMSGRSKIHLVYCVFSSRSRLYSTFSIASALRSFASWISFSLRVCSISTHCCANFSSSLMRGYISCAYTWESSASVSFLQNSKSTGTTAANLEVETPSIRLSLRSSSEFVYILLVSSFIIRTLRSIWGSSEVCADASLNFCAESAQSLRAAWR